MAKMENGVLTGVIGNLIFYQRNGESLIRTKPGPRKKKKGIPKPKEVTIFSMASKKGSPMIQSIKKELAIPLGLQGFNTIRGWMMNRIATFISIGDWPLTIASTPMLQLNPAAELRDKLLLLPECSRSGNEILFHFPAFVPKKKIIAPSKTDSIAINILVCSNSFSEKSNQKVHTNKVQYSFPYIATQQPEAIVSVPMETIPGEVTLVVMSIDYLTGNKINPKQIADDAWKPVAIVAMGKW